jgi:SNF2 family DNA or RNA helicase
MKLLDNNQQAMLRYAMHTEHPALFVEMRLRKTRVAVRRIKMYKNCSCVLIVAPYSAFPSWRKEMNLANVTYTEMIGTREERLDILWGLSGGWLLTNKECHLSMLEIADFEWDVVVLDESRCIANPQSRISRFFTHNFRSVKHRWILTGTPAPESPLEYYQQLKFLDPSILGYSNYYVWRNENFMLVGYDWEIKAAYQKKLVAILKAKTFTLKRQDVNLGGKKIYEQRECSLPANIQKIYQKAENEFMLETSNQTITGTIWATQKFIWLRRICGGIVDKKLVHSAKIDLLIELIKEQFKNEPIIIWAQFIDELFAIKETLDGASILNVLVYGKIKPKTRDESIEMFQKGIVQIFLAQPECFKHGVDLSCAETMIYYSTPMGNETRQQSEDRFVDVGKDKSLLVIDLICKDTIEEDIQISLQEKIDVQQVLHRRIKNVI